MGDDDKITKKSKKTSKNSTKVSARIFIEDELVPLKLQDSVKPYDLETEYGKTSKNRSFFVTITLIVCFLIVAAMVFGAYKIINYQNYVMDLNSDFFESTVSSNIKEEIERTKSLYEASLSYINELQEEQKKELEEALHQYNYDLYVIDSMKISDLKDVRRKKDSAKNDYKKKTEDIQLAYGTKIASATNESLQYKERLDSYSKQQIKNAFNEDDLDQEKILQRLEKEKLVEDYENRISTLQQMIEDIRTANVADKKLSINVLSKKFSDEIDGLDPVLSDVNAKKIIASGAKLSQEDFALSQYTEKSKVKDENLRNAIVDAQKKYENYSYLYGVYSSLPMKNSIPSYMRTSHRFVVNATNEIVNTSVQSVNELSEKLEQSESEVSALNSIVLSVLEKSNAIALVISSSENSVRVYVRPEFVEKIKAEKLKANLKVGEKTVLGQIYEEKGQFFFEEITEEKDAEKTNLSFVEKGSFVYSSL